MARKLLTSVEAAFNVRADSAACAQTPQRARRLRSVRAGPAAAPHARTTAPLATHPSVVGGSPSSVRVPVAHRLLCVCLWLTVFCACACGRD